MTIPAVASSRHQRGRCRPARLAGALATTDPANATCYVAFDSEPTTHADAQTACSGSGGNGDFVAIEAGSTVAPWMDTVCLDVGFVTGRICELPAP